jgi:multidrug resistance efflux pump
MAGENRKPPMSGSIRYIVWFAGLTGLAAGTAGVVLTDGRGDTAAAGPPAAVESGVVCFGHVDVKYGVASLLPLRSGRVAEVLARENQAVTAGAVLLRLEDDLARARVSGAEADLGVARAQLARARLRALQHRTQVAQQEASLEAMRFRLAAVQHALKAKLVLRKVDAIGKLRADPVITEEAAALEEQVEETNALFRAQQEKLAELRLHDPQIDIQGAEEDIKAKQALLQQAREDLEECAVVAPADGHVLRILVGPGDVLNAAAQEAVVLFCPDVPRFVRAELEQEFAYRVAVGQPATIRDDSSAPSHWTGRVAVVSDWYTNRRSVLKEPLQFNDVRTLECLIDLDPGQPLLRIGQRVRVTINDGRSPQGK